MPERVYADIAALLAYTEVVEDTAAHRRRALDDASAALHHYFASAPPFGPSSSDAAERVAAFLADAAIDAIGARATADAFRAAEVLMAVGLGGRWAPSDDWVEAQRRAWLARHHPQMAEAAVPTMGASELLGRVAEIDARLGGHRRGGFWTRAALTAIRNALVLEAMVLIDALDDAIRAWRGTDNDPILDGLVRQRDALVGVAVDGDRAMAGRVEELTALGAGARRAVAVAATEAGLEGRIDELQRTRGLARQAAVDHIRQMDQRLAAIISQGYDGAEATAAYTIAEHAGLDLDRGIEVAAATGRDLVTVLGELSLASGLDMTHAELQAFLGLGEHFATFDAAIFRRADGRVSADDLAFVIATPERFTSGQVRAAEAILESEALRARLDTAAGNIDILDGDSFGSRTPGDGLISRADLDAFMVGAHLNNVLGPHRRAIDTAGHGGRPDGRVSRTDLRQWLADPANADVDEEVRDGVALMLERELYDQGWWEHNRDAVATGAAIVGGGAVIIVSGGTATPTVVVAAGAGAAAGTTLAVNASSGRDLPDGLFDNAMGGAMIGLHVAALPASASVAATVGSGVTVENLVAVSSLISEVGGVVTLGGLDLVLPDEWEEEIHDAADLIGDIAALPETIVDDAGELVRQD